MIGRIQIDRTFATVEMKLSYAAAIPVVGTFAGAAKMILGTIQAVGGLLAMVASAPFAWTDKGRHVFLMGVTHSINGIANVAAGAFEAIPLVGSVIGVFRYIRGASGSDAGLRAISGQEHTIFVGYRTLEESARYTDLYDSEIDPENLPKDIEPRRVSPRFAV